MEGSRALLRFSWADWPLGSPLAPNVHLDGLQVSPGVID